MSTSLDATGSEAPWSSISTNLLRAELRRRQDDENERPACGSGEGGHYDTGAHVFALFLILTLSTLACGFPLLSRRVATGPWQKSVIFYCQHIGTGVLLATAFVHLLPVAFHSLTDPCLPYFFSKGYTPLPGLVSMTSAIIVVAVESYLTARGAGHSHSHAHGLWEEVDHDGSGQHVRGSAHHGGGLNDKRGPSHRPTDVYMDDMEPAQGLVAGAAPLDGPRPEHQQTGESADAENNSDESDLDMDMDAYDSPTTGGGGRNSKYSSLKANGHSGHRRSSSAAQPASPEDQKRQMLQCLLLEAGILFHSVFIGMAVSVATGPAFVVFLIAISFHQSFEGLALGSRIAAIQFPRSSMRPWLMVLAYGVTTPVGQALGLFMHKMYDPQSMAGLLVVGFMNAISAGLLLYAGLVQLLAEDFLSKDSYKVLKGKRRLHAFLAVVGGAILMALVGAFA